MTETEKNVNLMAMEGRDSALDILKCICAFFVVWTHMPLDRGVTQVFRAVPFFFMITGYFYARTKEKGRTGVQIRKMLIMTVAAFSCYTLFRAFLVGWIY